MTKEKSLSLKRCPEGLLYICYRASCGIKGIVRDRNIVHTPSLSNKSREKAPNPYTRELIPLNGRQLAFFWRRYSLRSSAIYDWRWSQDADRVAMAINDFRGYQIGRVLRYYPELALRGAQRGPKAISYWDNRRVPLLHFEWHDRDSEAFVIVEDIISAKRVARYKNAIALLGSGLSDDSCAGLLEIGLKDGIVALDGDAWKKAKQIKDKYSLFFRNFEVATWSENAEGIILDPKDQTEEELLAWINK